MARQRKFLGGENPAINDISGEGAAEEHDLRKQEDPHPQRPRFALLLHVVEMVGQRAMMSYSMTVSQVLPPIWFGVLPSGGTPNLVTLESQPVYFATTG